MRIVHLLGLASAASVAISAPAAAQSLEEGFQNPPNSARPRVWWHWMNGNVTIDGIDKDLDWLSRIGIGGVQNFDASLRTPQIVAKRLVYMDPAWKAAFKHAVQTADAKGLEFAIAASPGWSETGGPWVKPRDGMKKLVWSETVVAGGKRFAGKLDTAPDTTGPHQTAKGFDFLASVTGGEAKQPPKASGGIAVIAVPTASPFATPAVTTGADASLDGSKLLDADLETTVEVPTLDGRNPGHLTLTYAKPVTARAIRFFIPHAKPPFSGPIFTPMLEAEVGGGWRKLADLPLGEATTTAGFPATTASRFRIVLNRRTGAASLGLGGSAPGAVAIDVFARPFPTSVKIGEARLSGDTRMSLSEAKAGFDIVNDYNAIAVAGDAPGLTADRVIDLTARVKSYGTLDWTPPKGTDWRVYRFGWSLTGKENHPATPEATGLEVDKYDAGAVRRYLETYLGMYRDTVGPELIGKRGIRALLTDSIEVGPSNWTPRMVEEFRARRGYDLMPWLPALAGEVIGTTARTEKFLSDYRQTLADLIADAHYGTVAKVARENGMIVYGEAHENGRPVLGDDLAMRRHTDVPMAALWTWNRGEKPRATLLGDMKGAASVAHVYGQNIVAAESMTAANSPWAFAPHDLKRVIDLEFAHGINRPVVHTSVHQPVDDKVPGLSLMIFGQYFSRHDSWAGMAKPWVDYMARTGFMLQQGRDRADIAYFYGEEAPVTGLFEFDVPAGLPKRWAYDFVNAEMLRDALSVEDGEIVAKGGARYKALFLGGRSASMTLPTLQRIAAMVDAGATLIGTKPGGSPALMDNPVEFTALADRLWANPRVVATPDVEAGMERAGVAPAFTYRALTKDAEILFVERRLDDGSTFWVNNRKNRAERVNMSFRVMGKAPELWNAITGESRLLDYNVRDGRTEVELDMTPEDAVFVVFRKAATVPSLALTTTTPTVVARLDKPWSVTFQTGRGAPAGVAMPTLVSLDAHADTGVKHFAGVATYTTTFVIPRSTRPDSPLWLDLGKVGDIAEVRVNGAAAGTTWFAPFRLDIGKLVKSGSNSLEVRVANTWVNRLIGDAQPGATKVAFTAAPTYKPDAPLRPSGLIGPVTLVAETKP